MNHFKNYFLFLLFVFSSTHSLNAQGYQDTLVELSGRRTVCNIDKISAETVTISYSFDDAVYQSSIATSSIYYIVYKGEKRFFKENQLEIPINTGGSVVKSLPNDFNTLAEIQPPLEKGLHQASLITILGASTLGVLFATSNQNTTARNFFAAGLIIGGGLKIGAIAASKNEKKE